MREAVHDLVRIGLVEVCLQRHCRVVDVAPAAAPLVNYTLLTLFSALVPTTVPTREPAHLRQLLRDAGNILEAVNATDRLRYDRAIRNPLGSMVELSGNFVLAGAVGSQIPGLAFRAAVGSSNTALAWIAGERAGRALRAALEQQDCAAIVRAFA